MSRNWGRRGLAVVWATVMVVLATGNAGGPVWGAEVAKSPQKRTTINKIYFMFHPVCWRNYGATPPPQADAKLWAACYERELKINERQKQFISALKPDAALVLFPIGQSPAMRELEEHATSALGPRCVIVRRNGWDPPAAWGKLDNPIGEFLNNPQLAGRAEFVRPVPAGIQTELETELRAAWEEHQRPKWNIGLLEVAYYSRMCAADIQDDFRKRNLDYDPATVRSETFGEGFEQCAMTWKQMLVPYLGFARPAENIFDLSVSGAPFLVNATLVERIAINDDLRLYLWKAEDGRCVGVYVRAWCRMRDPQLFAQVSPEGMQLEARETHNKQLWPAPDAPVLALTEQDGRLRVPVFNGIRRDFHWSAAVGTAEEPCYLIARGISMPDFRERLVGAKIAP